MISKKEKSKLKRSILNDIYTEYDKTANPLFDTIMLAVYFNNSRDKHDIALALRSLKADGFITVDFTSDDDWSEYITITPNGINYCYKNKGNKVIKYLLNNHLAIIAIIISIIALFK